MWRTKPETLNKNNNNALTRNNDITQSGQQNSSTQSTGMSFTMIFASIFGSFVGIALISRMFGPRRVEIVHKRQGEPDAYFDPTRPPPGPYRSV